MTDQSEAEPPLNAAIEDLLAHCQTPADVQLALRAWLQLGAEYMARECGRTVCEATLVSVRSFIRDAEPSRPWPE